MSLQSPTVVIAPMAIVEIRPSNRAYSTALAPDSFLRKASQQNRTAEVRKGSATDFG